MSFIIEGRQFNLGTANILTVKPKIRYQIIYHVGDAETRGKYVFDNAMIYVSYSNPNYRRNDTFTYTNTFHSDSFIQKQDISYVMRRNDSSVSTLIF